MVREISSPVSTKFGIDISGDIKAVTHVSNGSIKVYKQTNSTHHMIAGLAPATNILGCLGTVRNVNFGLFFR